MSYIKPSLIAKSGGGSENKNYEVVIIDLNDVASFPGRNESNVVMVGNFIMKPGKYITKLQVTSSKTSLPVTTEGEEDNVSISSLPEFSVPGSSLDLEEFIQNWTNKSLIVGVQVGACGGSNPFYRIYDSLCSPLSLLTEMQNNNDSTMGMVKFQQFSKTDLMPGRYFGTFTEATVADTVDADATDVDVTNGSGEYQLTDNAAPTEIINMSNAANNGKYTLLGSGGDNPATIQSGGNFVLVGGVSWQGLIGASITFNAISAGGGAHIFIETSRT